jgi:HAD superfamily hydrolase (TIGR01509 family)
MPIPLLVLFDMDDVLCTYDKPARIAYLARLAGITPAAVDAAIWGSGFEDMADVGQVAGDDYLRGFGERLGHALTLDEWVEARRIATLPRPEVLELARQVRTRAKIAILTNNPALLAENAGRFFPELLPLFGNAIYCSGSFGVAKPDPECFRRCVAAVGVAPHKAFFTDDREEHVNGARTAGLAGHHYTSTAGLTEALRSHGLL